MEEAWPTNGPKEEEEEGEGRLAGRGRRTGRPPKGPQLEGGPLDGDGEEEEPRQKSESSQKETGLGPAEADEPRSELALR